MKDDTMIQRSLLGLVLFFSLSAAQAADPCATQSNTLEMNACAEQTLKKTDQELNRVYKKVMDSLAKETSPGLRAQDVRQQLVEAQRAWIEFRDKDCKATYTYNEAGTLRTLSYLGCRQVHTEHRIRDLNQYLEH